ncbi:MAG: ribonuclease H-like domain-containing protein [Deltaproteobacteria bacterium]|nr:ribonuclease H-like domain-containing protein [Deltaproteobacteria bacterium]
MLQNTFIHISGVGRHLEDRLWEHGILTWDDFEASPQLERFIQSKYAVIRNELSVSRKHLADPGYFNARLKTPDRWRMFETFRPKTAYLDIETNGLFGPGVEITVIGVYDGRDYRAFINGRNLEAFEDEIIKYDLVVTFNGARFDLPCIKSCFRHVDLPQGHLDLMYLYKRLGYSGGLKRIEQHLGLARPATVAGMDGFQAVILWEAYQRGDAAALDTLVAYNREDTVNLEYLSQKGVSLARRNLHPRLWEVE